MLAFCVNVKVLSTIQRSDKEKKSYALRSSKLKDVLRLIKFTNEKTVIDLLDRGLLSVFLDWLEEPHDPLFLKHVLQCIMKLPVNASHLSKCKDTFEARHKTNMNKYLLGIAKKANHEAILGVMNTLTQVWAPLMTKGKINSPLKGPAPARHAPSESVRTKLVRPLEKARSPQRELEITHPKVPSPLPVIPKEEAKLLFPPAWRDLHEAKPEAPRSPSPDAPFATIKHNIQEVVKGLLKPYYKDHTLGREDYSSIFKEVVKLGRTIICKTNKGTILTPGDIDRLKELTEKALSEFQEKLESVVI